MECDEGLTRPCPTGRFHTAALVLCSRPRFPLLPEKFMFLGNLLKLRRAFRLLDSGEFRTPMAWDLSGNLENDGRRACVSPLLDRSPGDEIHVLTRFGGEAGALPQ